MAFLSVVDLNVLQEQKKLEFLNLGNNKEQQLMEIQTAKELFNTIMNDAYY